MTPAESAKEKAEALLAEAARIKDPEWVAVHTDARFTERAYEDSPEIASAYLAALKAIGYCDLLEPTAVHEFLGDWKAGKVDGWGGRHGVPTFAEWCAK